MFRIRIVTYFPKKQLDFITRLNFFYRLQGFHRNRLLQASQQFNTNIVSKSKYLYGTRIQVFQFVICNLNVAVVKFSKT